MYTGIVQGVGKVVDITVGDQVKTLFVEGHHGFFNDIFIGASVSIDGTCLTVTGFDAECRRVSFDVGAVTNTVTTLQYLQVGDEVNVERSAKTGMENGGHNLYGHVAGMAIVKSVIYLGEVVHVDIIIPNGDIKYFFLKGFIGLHGCSLTINRVELADAEISIDLIPETLRLTNLKNLRSGDKLNYEIDQVTRTIVDTLESIHRR